MIQMIYMGIFMQKFLEKFKRKPLLFLLPSASVLLLLFLLFFHSQQNADQAFSKYTSELFRQEISGNTITLHYTLKDPEKYGIKNAPISYGQCTTDPELVRSSVDAERTRLRSYNRISLSKDNRLTYDVLNDYLNSAYDLSPYTLYDEPLAPLTGTQSQLPVILSEYRFYEISDIENYLQLLTKTPEYFRSILNFEHTKSESGLFMASYTADSIIKECRDFVNLKESNYLYSSFVERLEELASAKDGVLTEKQREAYTRQNNVYIKKYIFPAYEQLISGLSELRSSGKNNNGLCYLPNGRTYYEYLVRSETGSSRSIAELQNLTNAQILSDLTVMQRVLTEDSSSGSSSVTSDIFSSQGTLLSESDPEKILSTLSNKITKDFPPYPQIHTQIKYVQKSMEEYLSPAFYMIPAIDNTSENVIYINKGHITDNLSLFTTFAHEGYPGHLYQNVYYASLHPNPIRCVLNYGGYTEGWATYSEMMSYYFSTLTKEQATIFQRNSSVILGLYALADMGIHYDGWKLADAAAFFHTYGITDDATIEDIYDLIIADPANYLKYYIGYLEFLELKKDAVDKWEDNFTLRLSQQEPVKFSFLAPFTKLCEFLPHEKKLLTGVSHHECITSFKVSIFIKSQSRHLIKHRTLKMYHFIMRQYQDIILTVCITHGKCHQMMIILTEIWIQLHIFREIVHPSHIPLQAET